MIFSIIGFIILGYIIRAIFKDKSIEGVPTSVSSWILQLFISAIIGLFVWSIIPERCKKSDDRDIELRYNK